ncbi:glucokinase [Alteromonas sediminis]|uniref:Glucokinase n=1 Tax=Alteromonas sediminis TaxID=2259342 RepID=A0A3N5Y520_9ALTE|nr:glucokinase [Alteromonas sediminis]RPJ68750.1 glucokinase [Alteromonas sediminis]
MNAHFVADVGGTNIRLATIHDGKLVDIQKMLCASFDNISDAIQQYFDAFDDRTYVAGCIAIACPTNDDQVSMTNHSWSFSKKALKDTLKLDNLFVINDFSAVAHSLPVLTNEQLVQVGQGHKQDSANVVVFGPGTGLGVEHMTWRQGVWETLDGEGGHVDFSPVDETDMVIWRFLNKKFGRASAEEVMSGRGLVNIYQALCEQACHTASFSDPAQITAAALDGSCALSVSTLNQFCRIMGSFAGNLALNAATHGGVYIGGGIASRFVSFLQQSDFRARFEAKGVMAKYVKDIPTYIITEPDHGLLGANAYLQQNIARNG